MTFMYLHLYTTDKNSTKLIAEVKTTGSPSAPSLGTSSSQPSHSPAGIFRIEEFTGLDNIETDDLIEIIKRREGALTLAKTLSVMISNEDLLDLVKRRMS